MRTAAFVLSLLGAVMVSDASAQRSRTPASPATGWPETARASVSYEGISRADQAFALTRLAEIEQVFRKIPELVNATEFAIKKRFFGGARPVWMPNGLAEYHLMVWLFGRFGPAREVAGEGCICITVTINGAPESRHFDEQGRPIFIEGDPGEPVPGATVVFVGKPSDEQEVSVSVTFTRGGALPWEPVSREEFLQALIIDAEGQKGEKAAEFRKSLEKTAYQQWLEGAPQRKKERDDLAVQLRAFQTQQQIAKQIADLEATEREVTEQLKAQDAEDRKRNQEQLATPTYGDRLRARIEAMSPEERRQPALVAKNWDLLPPGAPNGNRVLRPKLDFWRVRRSPVEIHSITVSISGSTGDGQSRPAVIHALQQTYRNLDWAALKRMVDGPQP